MRLSELLADGLNKENRMIPIATAVIGAIPSLIKLFDSDSRADGVKELTQTVVQEAGKKLGVDFKTKNDVVSHLNSNPEDAVKLREIETAHLQAIAQLDLKNKKEDNRHKEFGTIKQVEDLASARDMFKHASELQTDTGKRIISQTSWQIPLYMLLNLSLAIAAKKYEIDSTVVLAVGNFLGLGLSKAYEERSKILDFLYGATIAKVKKDKS